MCIGYVSTTFVDAVDVSECYSIKSENYTYCFYTSGSVLSWNESREFCALRNSTLPIITDEDIDSVFQQFIVNDSYSVIQNTSVWIDAHARPVNDSASWHWIDGRPSGRLPITQYSLDLYSKRDTVSIFSRIHFLCVLARVYVRARILLKAV